VACGNGLGYLHPMIERGLIIDAPTNNKNNIGRNVTRLTQLNSFAPLAIAVLIGLAGVGFGDDNTLPQVRVDGDALKLATQSYKYCWSAARLVNGQ
jgi:hypothetical protein